MIKTIAVALCGLAPTVADSAEKADFMQFFDDFQSLSAEFDPALSQLYADDAKIMGVRKKADGSEESMTIDGRRWKTIILSSMERAKQLGDRSEYTDVDIALEADRAKISATRYSHLDCFTDERFYIVVSGDEQLKVIEQFMETPMQSSCEPSETELTEFLQSTVEMINKQLPAIIDAETQLIKTAADGTKLTYHYVLLNYTSETLSAAEATTKLQPLVIEQSCNSPNMRPILDQNGSITYIYKGADAVQIAKLDIDKTACNG